MPLRPQVLIVYPAASYPADNFIFDLYSTSIGPGLAPSGISISPSSSSPSSTTSTALAFAPRTIFAKGVSSSSF